MNESLQTLRNLDRLAKLSKTVAGRETFFPPKFAQLIHHVLQG